MKVILNKDIKDIGKAGEVLKVKPGFARNFLVPRGLAEAATERKERHWEHLKNVAEAKKRKAVELRKELCTKLSGLNLVIKKTTAPDSDKLFGSITTMEISRCLEAEGYSVDKRDIHLEEPIKVLGTHKAHIKLGEGVEALVTVVVERA
jgi:large subunit ribosomal protein L9